MGEEWGGWGSWGAREIYGLLDGDAAVDLGEELQGLPFDASHLRWTEGAELVKDRVEEWAAYESMDQGLHRVLLEEGTDHINWDELAVAFREYYLDEHPELREA